MPEAASAQFAEAAFFQVFIQPLAAASVVVGRATTTVVATAAVAITKQNQHNCNQSNPKQAIIIDTEATHHAYLRVLITFSIVCKAWQRGSLGGILLKSHKNLPQFRRSGHHPGGKWSNSRKNLHKTPIFWRFLTANTFLPPTAEFVLPFRLFLVYNQTCQQGGAKI